MAKEVIAEEGVNKGNNGADSSSNASSVEAVETISPAAPDWQFETLSVFFKPNQVEQEAVSDAPKTRLANRLSKRSVARPKNIWVYNKGVHIDDQKQQEPGKRSWFQKLKR